MSERPLLRHAHTSIAHAVGGVAAAALVTTSLVLATTAPGGAIDLRTVAIGDVSINEGNAGTTQVLVTLTLDGPANGDEVVRLSTEDLSATVADLDYVALTNDPIDFAPGSTEALAALTVRGDTFAEFTDIFQVFIVSGDNLSVSDNIALVSILNDDATPAGSPGSPIVKLPSVIASLTSSTTMTVPVFSNSEGGVDCGVHVTISHLTTDAGDFVGLLAPIDLVRPAGAAGTSFTLPIAADAAEASETFEIHLTPIRLGDVTACRSSAVGTGTIEPPGVTKRRISISPASVIEGDSGTTPFTFTITANGALEAPCEYEVRAIAINDAGLVTSTAGPQLFDAGTSTDSVSFLVSGDTLVEPDGEVSVTLSVGAGQAACEPGDLVFVRGIVLDDDVAPPPPPPSGECVNGEKVTVTWPGITLGRTPSSFLVRTADALVELPEGRWSVKLTSYDPTHPGASSQNKERWGVRLYDGAGSFVDNTWFIDDLSTGSKWLTKSVGFVDVPEGGVAGVRATHSLAGTSSSKWGSTQSVVPSKAVFTCNNPL